MMDIQSRVRVTIKSLNIDVLGRTLQKGEKTNKQTNKQTKRNKQNKQNKQTNKHTNKLESKHIYFFKSVPGLPWTVPGSPWKVPAMEGSKISVPGVLGYRTPNPDTRWDRLGVFTSSTLLSVHT